MAAAAAAAHRRVRILRRSSGRRRRSRRPRRCRSTRDQQSEAASPAGDQQRRPDGTSSSGHSAAPLRLAAASLAGRSAPAAPASASMGESTRCAGTSGARWLPCPLPRVVDLHRRSPDGVAQRADPVPRTTVRTLSPPDRVTSGHPARSCDRPGRAMLTPRDVSRAEAGLRLSRPAAITRARNCRVRSSPASPSTCSGGPDSSTRPPSRKHTRSRHLLGEAHLVGGHQDGDPAAGQLGDDRQHLADQLRVQRRGDLVEQQQPRPHGQRPGDRHPLLLAAGEPVRVGVGEAGQPDPAQQLAGALVGLAAPAAGAPPAARA